MENPKTIFKTKYKLYEWLVISFRVTNFLSNLWGWWDLDILLVDL